MYSSKVLARLGSEGAALPSYHACPRTALQVHTYRAKPPPATPDILKCVLELLLALSDSPDLRQMHAKVGIIGALQAASLARPEPAPVSPHPPFCVHGELHQLANRRVRPECGR